MSKPGIHEICPIRLGAGLGAAIQTATPGMPIITSVDSDLPETWMTPFERPDRRCPKCEHNGYMFRGRKSLELPDGTFVETKYRCRSCSHDWWERIPAPPVPNASRGEAA